MHSLHYLFVFLIGAFFLQCMIFHFPGILSFAGGDAMVMFLLVFLYIAAASVADVVSSSIWHHPASTCYKLQGYLPTADSYMLIYDDCPIWM